MDRLLITWCKLSGFCFFRWFYFETSSVLNIVKFLIEMFFISIVCADSKNEKNSYRFVEVYRNWLWYWTRVTLGLMSVVVCSVLTNNRGLYRNRNKPIKYFCYYCETGKSYNREHESQRFLSISFRVGSKQVKRVYQRWKWCEMLSMVTKVLLKLDSPSAQYLSMTLFISIMRDSKTSISVRSLSI